MARHPPDIGPVATLLARTDSLSDVLAGLHARVQEAVAATCSVLLELDPDTRRLHPTSGRGLDHLASDAWCTDEASRAFAAEILATGRSRQIAPVTDDCPTLARRLKTPAAYVAPVRFSGQPLGLLVVGLRELTLPLDWGARVTECAAGFALALTHARLRQDLALQVDISGLVAALGQDGTTVLGLERLQAFCTGITRAFTAERVEYWRYDREAHRLDLVSAAPPATAGHAVRLDVTDERQSVAAALRQERAALTTRLEPGAYGVPRHAAMIPLRGRRRALGVLVVDGLRLGPGEGARLLPHFENLGSRFAGLLESTQLLADVIRARRELEHTFDSMRDPLAVCAPGGQVLRANEAFARFTGLVRSALTSQRISSLVEPAIGQWLDTAMSNPPGRGLDSPSIEMRDGRSGTTLHVSVTALAERQDLPEGFVIVLRDVTEDRQQESERAALRERLAQSETLSHLVAGIAHEINNPLQAVIGHVELVRRAALLPPASDSQMALVHREADRAARIVRNLLLLAGSGRIRSRPVSVNAAVARALANRRAPWRAAGIRPVLELDPQVPRVGGDALLLQQAVLNLLLNAEQAIGQDGGSVEIRTALDRARGRVEVRVHDSGPGIPEDVLPKLFDPFFTTKEAGRGLGLSLVLRIVHEHGGDIEVRNHPRGGAEFALYFPVPSVLK